MCERIEIGLRLGEKSARVDDLAAELEHERRRCSALEELLHVQVAARPISDPASANDAMIHGLTQCHGLLLRPYWRRQTKRLNYARPRGCFATI